VRTKLEKNTREVGLLDWLNRGLSTLKKHDIKEVGQFEHEKTLPL
jgi:hypothetical protein